MTRALNGSPRSAALISILNIIITSVKTELNHGGRYEVHMQAARNFGSVLRRMEDLLIIEQKPLLVQEVEEGGAVTEKVCSDWAEVMRDAQRLEQESPFIPENLLETWITWAEQSGSASASGRVGSATASGRVSPASPVSSSSRTSRVTPRSRTLER